MKKIIFLIVSILLVLISCSKMDKDVVVKIDGKNYTEEHFLRTIPNIDFKKLPAEKREELVNEYVLKKLAQIDMTERGLLDSGDIKIELDVWNFWRVVNTSYEKLVLEYIVTEKARRMLYARMSRELKARQLLISYKTTERQPVNTRSEKDALILANEIKSKITPQNFPYYCQKYSDDKHTKNTGGMIVGWVNAGRMVPSVDSALFSTEANTVSGIVKSSFGYHLFLVDSSRSVEIESYEDKQLAIKQLGYSMWESKINNRMKTLIDSLITNNPVSFDDERIESFYDQYSKLSKNVFHEEQFNSYDIMSIFPDSLLIGKIGNDEIDKEWIIFFLNTLNTKRPPRFTSLENVKALVTDNQIPYLIHELAIEKGVDKLQEHQRALDAQTANEAFKYYNSLIIENINPTEEEKEDFYNEYKEQLYKTDEMVVVKEVLVKEKKLADDLLERLNAGEKIELLAKKYSERNVGKFNDGKLPPIRKGQYGEMGKSAFALEIDEIGGPYKLGSYYSIIKLVEKLPSKTRAYEDVILELQYDYIRKNSEEITNTKYNALKEKHTIKINQKFLTSYNETKK
ncbi:MAG: peptidylprolyl isomerase [Candidatus Marinimicrobia bacterium]|nr:peptidylprolyl isomerase [Candidatus Neomarinimicrobiota bacterium]